MLIQMTDNEIIQGLIERDNHITEEFFYVKCRPLLSAVMRNVFSYPVEYNEMVAELYEFLMDDDCAKLKKFSFRSSVYQWLKVVATRFFIRHRDSMIEDVSKDSLYEKCRNGLIVDTAQVLANKMDVTRLLALMGNQRYADVLRHLIIRGESPDKYAESIGVTIDNLYNIKRRAMAAFTQIAHKYYSYGL